MQIRLWDLNSIKQSCLFEEVGADQTDDYEEGKLSSTEESEGTLARKARQQLAGIAGLSHPDEPHTTGQEGCSSAVGYQQLKKQQPADKEKQGSHQNRT